MDLQSKISSEKLFAVLIEQIMLLKTEVAINRSILESYIKNNNPNTYLEVLEQFELQRHKLHAAHAKELTDLLLVESDEMTNLLSKLLSKLNL